MKKRIGLLGLCLVIMALCFAGCQNEPAETYAVWTYAGTYEEFENLDVITNPQINDNDYEMYEISDIDVFMSAFPDAQARRMTREQITNYIAEDGWADEVITYTTDEFLSYNRYTHFCVAFRTGDDVVYLIR